MKQAHWEKRENSAIWPKEVDQSFRAIVFDWDGTAVPNLQPYAQSLVAAMESNVKDNVLLPIITGTQFQQLNRQALRFLSPEAKQRLYVCTNRGSEVYRFSQSGEPELDHQRLATPEENTALDLAAKRFQEYLESNYHLESEIISN